MGVTTADHAEAYVQRQGIWTQLKSLFQRDRPTEAQLTQVSMVSEIAIEQVFGALRLTEVQREALYPTAKDYAECAALYGWQLGREQARRELAAQAARARAEQAVAAD